MCIRDSAEGGLQNACSRAADSQRISQSQIVRLSGGILLYCDQTGNALACEVLASYGMSGSLGSDHGHINICGRLDLSEMDGKAVCKPQHVSGLKIGLDGFLIKGSLLLRCV